MTAWSFLAPLWRTLTRRRREASSFEAARSLLVRLGLTPGILRQVVEAGPLHPHFHYRHFSKPKKDGGRREIVEPDARLKRLQQEIIAGYFEAEQTHSAAVAYQKGKSIADHVWAHAGAAVLVTADVRDFFPSTRAAR